MNFVVDDWCDPATAPHLPHNVTVDTGCSLSADPATGITPSRGRISGGDPMAQVENASFAMPFHSKIIILPRQLGTNIGKPQKEAAFSDSSGWAAGVLQISARARALESTGGRRVGMWRARRLPTLTACWLSWTTRTSAWTR